MPNESPVCKTDWDRMFWSDIDGPDGYWGASASDGIVQSTLLRRDLSAGCSIDRARRQKTAVNSRGVGSFSTATN